MRVRFAEFDLDEANATLLREGRSVALAPTPFALLCALAKRPGTLLTKDALLDSVWGHQFVSESVLKTAISDLRTVLGDDPRQPRIIETVPRRGYRFIAAAAPAAAAHLQPQPLPPAAPPAVHDPAFIGRAAALQRLGRAWDAARAGRRSIVWIAGEPGIGKTTLIEHFMAGLGPVACGRGQCVESYGAGEPYLPVLEALGALCRGDATLRDQLRAVAPTWLLQLPWLCTAEERDALRRELAGVGPERMLREFGELLDRYAAEQPLLLVTEDLHWSDRATIQLIDFLARRRGGARVMWLASFRLAEAVALDHPLNAVRRELRLHGLCEEIVLDPFSETEVAAYVAGQSPGLAQDEAFVRGLHERTDGVPLFVASVLKEAEARTQLQGDGRADRLQVASIGIPENLVAIIDHYIARLGGEQRSLLSAAAACGPEFRAATVAHVLQHDPDDVAHTCDELVREQLWLSAARPAAGGDAAPYAFRHSLFRQVLYERMAPSARAQLHARVGAALERERDAGVPVPAAELAMHFDRGRQPMAALRHYVRAAQAALQQLGSEGCVALTERASALLDQVPGGPERDELDVAVHTLRGVSAVHALGTGLDARAAFQRAYELIDRQPRHPMRGLLLHGYGFLLSLRAEYGPALAIAERAVSLPQASEDPVLQLAAGIIHAEVDLVQGRPRAACNWAERGLAAVAALPDAPDLTYVADPEVTLLGMLGMELVQLGEVEQARARLQQAHERARQLRQPMTRLVALWYDALFSVRMGDPGRVAEMAEGMDALVDEFALAQGRTARRWFRGWADARRGRALEGHRRIREAYEENTRLGMLSGGSEVLGYAAEALLRAGDLEGAERELRDAMQVVQVQGERIYLPQLHLVDAAIAHERGQPDLA
ncbi:MAG: AAA family ATPase, partial [Ramlibacter sp.]